MLRSSGTAEIIRSHQKDDFYLGYLRSVAGDAVHTLLGPRQWIKWRKELDVLADIGYFTLTTISGFQTIGEEYVNIIQVDKSKRQVPSLLRRGLMVLFYALTPYCLQKLFDWLEKKLRSPDSQEIPIETREFLLKVIPVLKTAVTYVHRLHLSLFYLQGIFYHIAKRIFGVQYLQYTLGPSRPDSSVRKTFQLLGVLSLAQLCGSGLLQGYKVLKDKTGFLGKNSQLGETSEVAGFVSPQFKCALCLEERKHSTLTPCGHLYCWQCIHDWCQNKPECPLCRDQFEPHRLVYLQNMDHPGG